MTWQKSRAWSNQALVPAGHSEDCGFNGPLFDPEQYESPDTLDLDVELAAWDQASDDDFEVFEQSLE